VVSIKDSVDTHPAESQVVVAKDREGLTLNERQLADPELVSVIKHIQDGVLPTDDRKARELILGKTRYVMIDNVLYHLSDDQSPSIVLPQADRYAVFKEVHQGRFAGHLRR